MMNKIMLAILSCWSIILLISGYVYLSLNWMVSNHNLLLKGRGIKIAMILALVLSVVSFCLVLS